jgi:murein DD-endopeptidase MepM/ murein hydrolase activator NlpD
MAGARRRRVIAAAVAAVDTVDPDPDARYRAVDLGDPMFRRSGNPVVQGGRVTSGYLVERTPTHLHRGVDIAAKRGTPVRAMLPGTVVERSPDGARSGYGNAVLVEHRDGTASFYAHLSRFQPGLRAGSTVRAGTILGYVGQTQAPRPPMKMRPHLHLETFQRIRRGGGGRPIIHETSPERYDPIDFANAHRVRLV